MNKTKKLAALLTVAALAGGAFAGVAQGAPASAQADGPNLAAKGWADSKGFRNDDVAVFSLNTHVGLVVNNGGLRHIRRTVSPRPTIMLFQEIKSPTQLQLALRREMGVTWRVAPRLPSDVNKVNPALSYVAYDASKFYLRRHEVHNVTFGEYYGRQMPVAILEHKITGRIMVATSIHVAPLGNGFLNGTPSARARQGKQLQAYGERMSKVRPQRVAIAGGDVNQQLWLPDSRIPAALRPLWSKHIFEKVGMKAANEKVGGRVTIDDIFLRQDDFASFKSRRTYSMVGIRGAEGGHMGILTVISVKRLERPDTDTLVETGVLK